MTKDPLVRIFLVLMVGIAGLYLLNQVAQLAALFADVILIFFLGWLLAFILDPLVSAVHDVGVPRAIAAAVAYVGVLFLVVIAVVLLVPALTEQMVQIANALPRYTTQAVSQFQELQAQLAERGVVLDLSPLVNPQEISRRAEAIGPLVLSNAVGIATSLATFLFQVTLVLIVAFYITLDGRRIGRGIVSALPDRLQEDAEYFFASVNRAFAGFLRGQVIQSLLYASGTGATMSALGLPFVLLGTVSSGLLMLVPFVGPVVALVIPVLVALFNRPDAVWLTLGALIAIQQVLFNVIAPRIMSSAVGIHPLLVFLALLVGARVAGFWGVLFGVPVVAVLAAMVSFYRATMEQRRRRGPEVAPGAAAAEPPAQSKAQQASVAEREEVLLP